MMKGTNYSSMWEHKKQLAASRAADHSADIGNREGGREVVDYLE
jgi:hypothetical protein